MATDNEPLRLATFEISQIRPADQTRWSEGVLEVDLVSLGSLASEPGLNGVNVHVVRPGEPVRIMNVLDVVEPCVKVPDVDATFPGILGPARECGTGLTHRLEGASVLATADLSRTHPDIAKEMPDSIIDMAGAGAPLCRWSRTNNIVADFDCDPRANFSDIDR